MVYTQAMAGAWATFDAGVDAFIDALRPQLHLGSGTAVQALRALGEPIAQLRLGVERVFDNRKVDAQLAKLLKAVRDALEPMLGAVSDVLAKIPQSVDLKYSWEPSLKDAGPFLASRAGRPAKLRLDVRLTQDLLEGGPPNYEMKGVLKDCGILILPSRPFLTVEIAQLTFESRNGSSPKIDLKIGGVAFGDQLSFVAELAKLLSPDTGLYMEVRGDCAVAGYRLPLPAITSGAFSLIDLSINPEVVLPFDGTEMRARLSISTRQRPAIFGMGIFGGTLFVALESTPNQPLMIEGAIDGGAVTALQFLGARGVATATFGFYFQLRAESALLTGYFRAYGTFDVYGLITVNLEFYLGFTYTSNGQAYGECRISVKIGYGMFSYKVTVRARKTVSGNGGACRAALMGLERDMIRRDAPIRLDKDVEADWARYRAQFATWEPEPANA